MASGLAGGPFKYSQTIGGWNLGEVMPSFFCSQRAWIQETFEENKTLLKDTGLEPL